MVEHLMPYLLRRLAHGLGLLLALSLLTFLLAEAAPGDPFAELALDPTISPETLEGLRARYGLDRPLAERYLLWLGSLLRGEMGYSVRYDRPVGELIGQRLGATLILMGCATAIAWLLALSLGLLAADRPGGLADRLGLGLTAGLQALPEILLALLALLFALRSGLFPLGDMTSLGHDDLSPWGRFVDRLHHLALPVTVLVLDLLPTLLRHVREALVKTLEKPHLLTARALGIPRARRLLVHALPVAAPPLFALFGLTLARLVSSSLLVEVIFGWPGLGPLLLGAVLGRDLHVVLAVTLLSGLFLLLGNLLADLLHRTADPRVRSAEGAPS